MSFPTLAFLRHSQSLLYRFVWQGAEDQRMITYKPGARVIAVARSTPENTWAIQHVNVSDQDWRNSRTCTIDQSQELETD